MTFKQPVALLALALSVTLSGTLLGCSNASTSTAVKPAVGSAADSSEQATPGETPQETPQESAEAEKAARAEWEAQMQQIQSVLKTMDRDQLIGDSATKGPRDAEIVLIKFSDFQCPYCAIASADMKKLIQNHPDDVLFIYKQFPLVSIHAQALPAAKAAWAAGQQGKFWLYHDGLFAYQDKLGEDYYVALAKQIGLDMEKFDRDRNSPAAQAAIDKDVELAQALGMRGTPTFIMNGLLIPGGAPLAFFEEAISRLKASAAAQQQ